MTNQSRTVFLDVGGHLGQTLDEVLSDGYAFDHIHCFEPMSRFADRLDNVYGDHVDAGRLSVHNFGLARRTGELTLFGANEGGGASVFEAKGDRVADSERTTVRMVRASDFFQHQLAEEDRIVMKLNCEGSEGDILLDLAESGLIHRIADVMIDFDLFKVRGRRHEPYEVLRKLREVGFEDYHLALDAMVGPTHQDRIRNWLSYVDRKIPLANDPQLFDGLPRRRRLLKRALRTIKHRTLGMLDASPLNRAG